MRVRVMLLVLAAISVGACAKNPMGSSAGAAGLSNGTSYAYVNQVLTNDVMFSPSGPADTSTRAPKFGGPITYSWGGVSRTEIAASGGVDVTSAGAVGLGFAPPTTNILLKTGGIGGPADYFVRWRGFKGGDASVDYSSFVMYFTGNQVNFNLKATGYRGFTFFARGKGNFYVALSAGAIPSGQTGPYQAYNFYSKQFGNELDPNNWRQITVLFTELVQLYGAAVDLNNVLLQSWGLQFEQQPPLVSDFELDVDYIRFF